MSKLILIFLTCARLTSGSQYELKPKLPVIGSALHIPLPRGLRVGSSVSVKIRYTTTKESTALQWLTKECVATVLKFLLSTLTTFSYSDKRKGSNFPIFLASVNQFTHQQLPRFKVLELRPLCALISNTSNALDTPANKIVRRRWSREANNIHDPLISPLRNTLQKSNPSSLPSSPPVASPLQLMDLLTTARR